jgi:hypothetical protein
MAGKGPELSAPLMADKKSIPKTIPLNWNRHSQRRNTCGFSCNCQGMDKKENKNTT